VSDLRHQAILIGIELEARVRPEAAKVLTVREGETAWSVAAREYGSAEYANYLIEINHLQGAKLVPGTTLRIPARPFGAAPDVEPTDTDVIDLQNPVPCQV
jgi:LysM repeat protein